VDDQIGPKIYKTNQLSNPVYSELSLTQLPEHERLDKAGAADEGCEKGEDEERERKGERRERT
jgi:hypothetical protein